MLDARACPRSAYCGHARASAVLLEEVCHVVHGPVPVGTEQELTAIQGLRER